MCFGMEFSPRKFFGCVILLLTLLITSASADSYEYPTDFTRFYRVKTEVKDAIASIAQKLQFAPNKTTFEQEMKMRLNKLSNEYPESDFKILAEKQGDDLYTAILVGFTEGKHFIGWRFNTVFYQNKVYFYVHTQYDRVIKDLPLGEYYEWKKHLGS